MITSDLVQGLRWFFRADGSCFELLVPWHLKQYALWDCFPDLPMDQTPLEATKTFYTLIDVITGPGRFASFFFEGDKEIASKLAQRLTHAVENMVVRHVVKDLDDP